MASRTTALRVVGVAFCLLALPMSTVVAAQNRPRPAVEVAAGWVGFADDGIVSEGLIGGAARFYLLPRVSIGPELVYIGGTGHNHLIVTGNVTWDLFASSGGRAYRTTPFLVVGGGLFQTRESLFTGSFTSSEGAFTAGGGVRTAISDRVTAGIEARAGWETHLRISGLVGVQLGGGQ